jgi:hypothetical protein
MSQQQDSQGSLGQSEDDEEQHVLSSLRLMYEKDRRHQVPKSEHPSTYDTSIPPLSYHAQDAVQASSSHLGTEKSTAQNNRQSANAGNTSDIDAFETTYCPYSQYTGRWQVPPWAKPQQNNAGTLQILLLLLIAIIVFPGICIVTLFIMLLPVDGTRYILSLFMMLGSFVLCAMLLVFALIAIVSLMRKIRRIKPPSWW